MYYLISYLLNNPSTTYDIFYSNDNNENGNSIQYGKSMKKSSFICDTELQQIILTENSEEEEAKKTKELLNNGIEIYKRIIFEEINSNNYDKSTYDSTESNIMIFQSCNRKEKR